MRFMTPVLLLALAAAPALPPCGQTDADGDGVPAPTDCDDTHAGIYPGAPETCNGIDDDCDGVADPGCPALLTWTSRYSGVAVTGSSGREEGFDELEETYTFEPFAAEVSGFLDMGGGWSIAAHSAQTSTLGDNTATAEGEVHIQLQDSRGGGGGGAAATNHFEARFVLAREAALTVDLSLSTDIYERAEELSVFVELSGPDGEVFTDALVNTEGVSTQTHPLRLPEGTYWLQVEAYTTSSLSGYWDDYPGSTANWQVSLSAQ